MYKKNNKILQNNEIAFPLILCFCAILFREIHGWAMFKKNFFIFQSMVVLYIFLLYFIYSWRKILGKPGKAGKKVCVFFFVWFFKKEEEYAASHFIYNISYRLYAVLICRFNKIENFMLLEYKFLMENE